MPAGDGFSPIIDAIVNWQTQKRQAASQELDKKKQAEVERSNKVQEQQRQQQLDQARREIDQQHELDKLRTDAQRDTNYAALIDQLTKSTKSGVDLSTLSKTDEGGNQYFEAPSGLKIPLGLIPDYKKQGEIQNEADYNKAFNTTLGQETASAPFDEAKDKRQAQIKKDMQDADNAFQMRVEQYRQQGRSQDLANELASRERIARVNNDADNWRASLAAKVKLSSPSLFSEDDNIISNAVNDVYITGNTPEDKVPAKLRMALKGAVPKGWTPINKKDDEVFSSVQQIGSILDDARHLADTASYDVSATSAMGAGLGMFGDAAATKRRLTARAGELAKYFGKEVGVKTQKDIERAMDGAYSPYNTQEQNSIGVAKLQSVLDNAAKIVLKKYNPDQAQAILAKRGIDGSRLLEDNQDNGDVEEWVRDSSGKLVPKEKK